MRVKHFLVGGIALIPLLMGAAREDLQRGRYLVQVGGCNDCHTPGYGQAAGKIPEARWLTGNAVGFKGPWGVTFPVNLRLLANGMTERQWLDRVVQPALPPMPYFNLQAMSDSDRRAIYQYLRSLGPLGTPAPNDIAPGESLRGVSFIDVTPQLAAKD